MSRLNGDNGDSSVTFVDSVSHGAADSCRASPVPRTWPPSRPSRGRHANRHLVGPYSDRVPKPEPGSRGVLFGFAAYGLWGLFPLYFDQLASSSALEILAHRLVWTFLLALIGIAVVRQWDNVRTVLSMRRVVGTLAVAGVVVAANWGIYVWAVVSDWVVDAALGYFINPLVTVAVAVVALHEKLRKAQIVALAIGAAAVVVLIVGYGQVPWIALALAVTFATYSFAKNRVGPYAKPLVGLGIETTALTPIAAVFIVWLQATGTGTLLNQTPLHTWLLLLAGVVTAAPLLFFAAAASRIPLSTLGLIQYVTPTLQFIIGLVVNREVMPPARWAGFALIWCALIVLTWDSVRVARAGTADLPAAA